MEDRDGLEPTAPIERFRGDREITLPLSPLPAGAAGIGIYTNTRRDFTLPLGPLGGSSDSEGRAEDAQALTATEP